MWIAPAPATRGVVGRWAILQSFLVVLVLVAALTPAPLADTAVRGVSTDVFAADLTGLTTTMRTVLVNGTSRSYRSVTPTRPVGRLPLLVVLHGRGQTPQGVISQTGFLRLARTRQALLVYPDGEQRSWNAGRGCCGVAGARGVPDVAFLTTVLSDAEHALPVDPKRVYLVGYSNGGKLAYDVACSQPGLFAAVATYGAVPLARCAQPGSRQGATPVLLAAGQRDTALPFGGESRKGHFALPGVTEALAWLRTQEGCGAAVQGSTLGFASVQQWTGCRGGSEVEEVVYPASGHAWPEAQAVGESAAAATLMWDFFSLHPAA